VATIRYLRKHQLVERCRVMGQVLHESLGQLRSSSLVGDIRGRGLLAGIEFVADRETRRPFPRAARVAETFADVALELGLVVWPNSGHLSDGTGDLGLLAPPFIISQQQIEEMIALLQQVLERTAARIGAQR
jgi:adenosylmethionine-8-amino-7-oxononanoate aminotransferase